MFFLSNLFSFLNTLQFYMDLDCLTERRNHTVCPFFFFFFKNYMGLFNFKKHLNPHSGGGVA